MMNDNSEMENASTGHVDTVGSRLKSQRTARKITVKKLAETAGVSVGMISQIERDLSSPSIRILLKLCHALDIPLTSVFGDGHSEKNGSTNVVRRRRDRPIVKLRKGSVVKEILSPAGDYDIHFMIISMEPHSIQPDVVTGPGEKAGIIIGGAVVLRVADTTYNLSEGDSFQFSSELAHSISNESDHPSKLIWLMNTKDIF